MQRVAFGIGPALILALASCGPPANLQDGGGAASGQTQVALDRGVCDATLYAGLVGEPIGIVDSLNTGLVVRVLGPEDFVTRDYDPNRLTFTTTPDFTIGRVFCG